MDRGSLGVAAPRDPRKYWVPSERKGPKFISEVIMAQLTPVEFNRLRWLFKLERQETLKGSRSGWVPGRSEKDLVQKLMEKGFIASAVITEKGVGYGLTRSGSAAVGD